MPTVPPIQPLCRSRYLRNPSLGRSCSCRHETETFFDSQPEAYALDIANLYILALARRSRGMFGPLGGKVATVAGGTMGIGTTIAEQHIEFYEMLEEIFHA